MSSVNLKERYLNIAQQSLLFLKEQGFKKKGTKYVKQNGELIFEISASVPRPWFNSDTHYEFQIEWQIMTDNYDFINFSTIMNKGKKNIKNVFLIGGVILPDSYSGKMSNLSIEDEPEKDLHFIKEVREIIKSTLLPWYNGLNSIDDIIHIAEEECKIEREKREFYRHTNIYEALAKFFSAKGQKDKALEMCDLSIDKVPVTAKKLAEKGKKEYIKYFETLNK